MPIALVQPLPIGTALRLFLEPSPGAERWRVLRRPDAAFSGHDDPGAAVVLDTCTDVSFLDSTALRNGQTYHYRLYRFAAGAWGEDGDATGTPAFSVVGDAVDPLMFVRDRLDDGLNAMIASGLALSPHGRIAVLTAPPAFDDTNWPVVTVHLSNDASGERALGEVIDLDSEPDEGGMVTESEGWLSRIAMTIVSWSLNPDERAQLRHAINTLVIGNLPVFEAAGLQQVDLSQDDTEDFTSFDAPVYQTVSTLRCLAPSWVSSKVLAIRDITMTMSAAPRQAIGFGRPYRNINRLYYR